MTAQPNKSFSSKNYLSQGFTLIELMVVIAIIAIISVVAITLFSNVQADARDGKRKAELEAIANVLEVNKTNGGTYNPAGASLFGGGVFPGGGVNSALDPQNYNYCILTSITSTVPAAPSAPEVAAWTVDSGAQPCPGTYVRFNNTPTVPADTTVSWRICTRLENRGGTPTAQCRTNTQ